MINTFTHSCSFLKNHTWFQTKMGKTCITHFQTKTAQKLLWGRTYLYGLCTGVPPPPRGVQPHQLWNSNRFISKRKALNDCRIVFGWFLHHHQMTKAVKLNWNAGCSWGIGDQRILSLLHRILQLMFGVLWLFLFRCGASFKIFHCDITPSFSCN